MTSPKTDLCAAEGHAERREQTCGGNRKKKDTDSSLTSFYATPLTTLS